MSFGFLQEIGVDVDGMEARSKENKLALHNGSPGLPRLSPLRKSSGGGPVYVANPVFGVGGQLSTSPDGNNRMKRSSSDPCIRPGSRPGSSSASIRPVGQGRPESGSAVVLSNWRGKVQPGLDFRPQTGMAWELGSLGLAKGTLRKPEQRNSSDPYPVNPYPPASLEGLQAVIFLDIDGVVHPTTARNSRKQFVHLCMLLLTEVAAKVGQGLKIVLSTAWRHDSEGRREVAEKLLEYNLPAYVSCTPNIGKYRRAREILTWVHKYKPVTWVAIDDLPLLEECEDMKNHFVQTHAHTGLRQKTADKVVHLFQAQRRSLENNVSSP